MSKKPSKPNRPLSARVRQELEDTDSYIDTLDPKDRQWLLDNYIDPELMQRFTTSTPQSEKQRIWRQSKRELACVDGCPGWLEYNSDLLEPPATNPDLIASVSKFLDTIKK